MAELFATLERVRPEGLRYASTRVADSSTFVILTGSAEGHRGPPAGDPRFRRFLERLQGLVDGPPVIEQLDVVGPYNLFGPGARRPAVR